MTGSNITSDEAADDVPREENQSVFAVSYQLSDAFRDAWEAFDEANLDLLLAEKERDRMVRELAGQQTTVDRLSEERERRVRLLGAAIPGRRRF